MNRTLVRLAVTVAAVATATGIAAPTAAAQPSASPTVPPPAAQAQTDQKRPPQQAPLKILLSNDDGWRGAGGADTPLIVALRNRLRDAGHQVVVVAPGTDQSGQGGRITIPPLKLTVANPEPDVWTLSPGSPSDSVYFAMDEVFKGQKPDLVVSGMNPGGNLGQAVSHSGTFNAASAALEFGIPAIAVSLEAPGFADGFNRGAADSADYVARLVAELQAQRGRGPLLPAGIGLNVNIPLRPGPDGGALKPSGAVATTLATVQWAKLDYVPDAGPTGTYSISIAAAPTGAPRGTDVNAVQGGFTSITPFDRDRDLSPNDAGFVRQLLRVRP